MAFVRGKRNSILFFSGLVLVLLSLVPGILLGKNAIFTYHDQLDGELIAYVLQARHLSLGGTLPEFMNGASKTALTMPAPAAVLLFLIFDAEVALTILLFLGRMTGYIGMFLLVREVTKRDDISMLLGILYGLLPFLPVYGLSQFGIPLLFWCYLQIRDGKHLFSAYLYTCFFALLSSLVLVGYGILGMGVLVLLWKLFENRHKTEGLQAAKQGAMRVFGMWLLLLGIYIAENARLLAEMLFGNTTSHKAEYTLSASHFVDSFVGFLLNGGQHSEDYHFLLLIAAMLCLVIGLSLHKRLSGSKHCLKAMAFCLGWNAFFCLVSAFWGAAPGIAIRENLSALGAFQLDRLLWIAPTFWYLFFGCALALVLSVLDERKVFGAVGLIACGIAYLATGAQVLLVGDIKTNVQKLRNPEYAMMSYSDYYAIGVMDQIEAYIAETTGLLPEEYRIVSLGIDPAAALYQGFYCLDGYSNNYSLDYKHTFRQIIAPELAKSEYLTQYFDGWGNRCYLFSSEAPGYYTIEKGGFAFFDLRIDTDALKSLGGKYIFSAAYILYPEERGLKLLREEPFATEDSYYQIYLYEVE